MMLEAIILTVAISSTGVLGLPPQPENPAMQHVAPAKCVMYSTWSAMAAPDAKSANQTEQLLAEAEVQALAAAIEKAIAQALAQMAEETGDPKARHAAKFAPGALRILLTRSAAVFATRIEVQGEKVLFEGGVLLDAGDGAAGLADGLVQLIASPEMKPVEVTLTRSKFQRFATIGDEPLPFEITVGSAGQYVLVGFGKGAVEGMIERLRAKQVPAWLTALQKRLPVERRASLSYLDVKAIADAFVPLAGPEGKRIAQSLGVDQIGAIEMVTGLDKDGMVSRSFLEIDGEPKGLTTLFSGAGITPEQVAFIPKDATFAGAFSLDPIKLYDVVGRLVTDLAPAGALDFGEAEKQFADQFGTAPREIAASLGHVWTYFMSPADGWLGATVTIEVRDRAKLAALLTNIRAKLEDAPPRAPRIIISKFGQHEIMSLAAPDLPIRPAWCLTESALVFSVSPQSIKAHLDARASEVGLFARPEFAAAFKEGSQTISLGYQDSAKLFEATYSSVSFLLPFAQQMMEQEGFSGGRPGAPPIFDMLALPSARSIQRHLRPGISIVRRTADGIETESRQTFPTPSIGASAPVAVALLLPAVQAAREAARRMQSSNNLKQIALAVHNYDAAYKGLPPAYSVDKEGKPLLSWRVHILPYIEQQALYEQFKLDEPWDSEHNKKLIGKIPETFRSPNSTAAPGKTTYLGVGGAGGMFSPPMVMDGRARGISFAQVRDGLSNTIMVVEATDDIAADWTKPQDFVPNEKDPHKGLIGTRAGGFLGAFGDGAVRMISQTIDAEMLRRLLQRADGLVVDHSKL